MAKSNTFDNDFLKLIFNATPISNLADNAGTSPLTVLWVALHHADPTAAGNQSSNEVSYTGYARVGVARDGTGWTITNGSVSPTTTINFPLGTGGTDTATFASVGTAQTGAGKILYSGALAPSVACGNGVTPQITANSAISET